MLDQQGNILTNDHVIEAAAAGGSITVDFARGRAQVPAAIVGRDPATGLPRGALVEQVLEGLGAAKVGIRQGDVITKIGDDTVNSVDQMLVAIRRHNPGDTINVTYTRNGSTQSANVAVAAA